MQEAQFNRKTMYRYYGAPAAASREGGLPEDYLGARKVSQALAVAAALTPYDFVSALTASNTAEVAAAKAPNGMAPAAAATVMNHAPLPRTAPRKFVKKLPTVVQPVTCEVCRIQCDTLDRLIIHKTGKKHKKNLTKLQDAITPKPANPPNTAVGASTGGAVAAVADGVMPAVHPMPAAASTGGAVAAVADGVMPAVHPMPAAQPMPAVRPKKNKSSAAAPADLQVKKRRVVEAGAAEGEVKICTACNVVVNSQKVYELHIAGPKHKANVQKQQQAQLHHVA